MTCSGVNTWQSFPGCPLHHRYTCIILCVVLLNALWMSSAAAFGVSACLAWTWCPTVQGIYQANLSLSFVLQALVIQSSGKQIRFYQAAAGCSQAYDVRSSQPFKSHA